MKILNSILGSISLSNAGQSYIMQFVLFFLIGLGLFMGLGNFFSVQYQLMRRDTADISIEMINGYLSSLAVASVDSCMQCGAVENNVRIGNTTAGYFLEVELGESGLTVSTAPAEKEHTSSINNLNHSLLLEGSAPSIRPINLTYDRNQNKLEIR
jgi:hypothetical protein